MKTFTLIWWEVKRMLSCIFTDLTRVIKKKSVIIWFVIQVLIFVGAAVMIFFVGKAGLELGFSPVMSACFNCATVIIGIPVFLAVFKDDLQSKAMQNTIGMGVSRDQLVLSRFIEIAIIYVVSFVLLFVVSYIVGIPFGIKMPEHLEIAREAGVMLLKMICYCAISMIVVFGTMNTSFAQTIFLLLNFGIVGTIIQGLNLIPFFVEHKINLSYATIDGLLGLAKDKTFAAAPFMWVVIIGVFLVLPLILTIIIFRRKELSL